MVETDDDDAKDQAPESNLRNCTLRENNVKEQVEGVVLASKTVDKVESHKSSSPPATGWKFHVDAET